MVYQQLKKERHDGDKMRLFVDGMRSNGDVSLKISMFNERMMKRYQQDYYKSQSELESCKSRLFELETNKKLYLMKYSVLEENFKMLFNSIDSISSAKNLEDKYKLEMELNEIKAVD